MTDQREPDAPQTAAGVPAPRTRPDGGPARPAADRPARLVQAHVQGLLAEHVPICLILDLAMPSGPHSQELLEDEGLPDGAWWEPRPGS